MGIYLTQGRAKQCSVFDQHPSDNLGDVRSKGAHFLGQAAETSRLQSRFIQLRHR